MQLGYDAYLPLLHCHGLKAPKGMQGVDLGEWKANVRFAIQAAAEKATRVSIGGLSTGGALSFYMACTKPRITGDLYLFSAALDLAGGPLGLIGEFKQWLLGTPLAKARERVRVTRLGGRMAGGRRRTPRAAAPEPERQLPLI